MNRISTQLYHLEILWCVEFALTSIATDHINFKIELQEFMETNFSPDIITNASVLKILDEILPKYELLIPPKPEFWDYTELL